MSRTSTKRILKTHKFHAYYKISLTQELNKDGGDSLLKFCRVKSERTNENPQFCFNIRFSDELIATIIIIDLTLILIPEYFKKYTRQKLNVWAITFRNHIICPFSLKRTVDTVMT